MSLTLHLVLKATRTRRHRQTVAQVKQAAAELVARGLIRMVSDGEGGRPLIFIFERPLAKAPAPR